MTQKSMNGRQQADALARLAKPLNTEQNAPAESAWQPDQLGGIKVGDYVRLPNVDAPLLVIDLADPVLILQSPSGHQLRAGWRAVSRVRTKADISGPDAA